MWRSPTVGRSAPSISACQDAIRIAQAMWPAHDTSSADDHTARKTWPSDGTPSYAPRPTPTPSAWDGEPAAHRRRAAPQQPAEYHARAIEQTDDEDDGPQTCRWSGGGPSRGRGHAPRAQGRHSPTAEYHARTIARLEATVNAYTWVLERGDNDVDDNDQPRQTARWSGGGPSRGRGGAP
jgi:hypothetical protein